MRNHALALIFLLSSAPALAQEDPIAAGQTLYDEKCAVCHGAGLRNTGATADLRALKQDERARFDTAVLNGKGQMPPWRGVLNETHLDQLWAYIRDRAFE